jgi:hypothetical protein
LHQRGITGAPITQKYLKLTSTMFSRVRIFCSELELLHLRIEFRLVNPWNLSRWIQEGPGAEDGDLIFFAFSDA